MDVRRAAGPLALALLLVPMTGCAQRTAAPAATPSVTSTGPTVTGTGPSVAGTTALPYVATYADQADVHREYATAHARHPSAARVVRTGHVRNVLADRHGDLMVTWVTVSEEDEGPSWLAWRTYRDDRQTGQGTVPDGNGTITAAADTGFLVSSPRWERFSDHARRWRTVSPTGAVGTTTNVALEDETTPRPTRLPQRGDAFLNWDDNAGPVEFYSPADRQVFTAALPPGTRLTDAGGGAWSPAGVLYETTMREGSLTVHATADEGRSWSRGRLPGFTDQSLLASDRNAVMLSQDRHPRLALTTDGGSWTRFSPRGLPVSDLSMNGTSLVGYDDEAITWSGRLLVGGATTGWRLAVDATNRVFRAVPLPPVSAQTTHLATVGTLLFAICATHRLWVSKDDGQHWLRFDTDGS